MALAKAKRPLRPIDYWPGLVNLLSALLLGMIFLLSVFMLAQFYVSRAVIGKDAAVSALNRQTEDLAAALARERSDKAEALASFAAAEQDRARLQAYVDRGKEDGAAPELRIASAEERLGAEKQISARASAQAETLAEQAAELRRQLSAREEALAAAASQDRDQQAKIAELNARLDAALEQKAKALAAYRTDFFARLQSVLGSQPGLSIVGDRFILQSEILFGSGQATVNPAGRGELDKLAAALIELDHAIPPDIPWLMRIDGHTDKKSIQSKHFASNWALSSARAIAVVQYLIGKGVPPQRLAAAGFGEFQPLDPGEGDEAFKRNRRIELKITDK
ncbi:peptidoglycan -binding protein [Methylocapsa acidiphila]|uniref:peptidoglycan -binding protein n=1 Tax=Methylocapsa acidiphila TaxID=133552 RepID=UPI00047D4E22|nr:peptidoglycan -binding protein [Methylocapsa acidiphila]